MDPRDKPPYMSYVKTDFTRCCSVNEDLALSFYQMDYQALADALRFNEASSTKTVLPGPALVARVVMNQQAFVSHLQSVLQVAWQVGLDANEIAKSVKPKAASPEATSDHPDDSEDQGTEGAS